MKKLLIPAILLRASILGASMLAAGVLAGCGALSDQTPPALPTVVLDGNAPASAAAPAGAPANANVSNASGGVTASGRVAPAQEARLAFVAGGEIEMLEIEVGDRVQAGQILARLTGTEQLQAAVSAAELEVLSAQQALQKLSDDLLEEQTAAQQAVNEARKALHDAQQELAGFAVPSEPLDIDIARSNVALARNALDDAREDFAPYENKPEDNLKRAELLNKLSEAQQRYDHAVRQLNRLTGEIVPEFDRLQTETELEIALARLQLAEEQYQLLLNGPDPADVELAQARLESAEDQAAAARANLANLELKAPFAGTVSALHANTGEWVIPGQAILVLADLENLRVETNDLSERDIPAIEVGQAATIFIEALNLEVSGQVSAIAPLADTLGGDVVYKTTVTLDEHPAGLRAGMSVDVQFHGGD